MNSWSIFDLDRFFFVILMKPKCCYYYYFFPLGRILLCVHIYLDEIKVQTQNKYVLIVVHIWSMLQTSRVRYGKNSNASWPYYVFKQKGGERKSVFWSYQNLQIWFFFVKEDWGMKGEMFTYICNTKTKPISIGMLYKLILIR